MVDDTLITYIKICLKHARESKDDDLVYLNQPAVNEILKRLGSPASGTGDGAQDHYTEVDKRERTCAWVLYERQAKCDCFPAGRGVVNE